MWQPYRLPVFVDAGFHAIYTLNCCEQSSLWVPWRDHTFHSWNLQKVAKIGHLLNFQPMCSLDNRKSYDSLLKSFLTSHWISKVQASLFYFWCFHKLDKWVLIRCLLYDFRQGVHILVKSTQIPLVGIWLAQRVNNRMIRSNLELRIFIRLCKLSPDTVAPEY